MFKWISTSVRVYVGNSPRKQTKSKKEKKMKAGHWRLCDHEIQEEFVKPLSPTISLPIKNCHLNTHIVRVEIF